MKLKNILAVFKNDFRILMKSIELLLIFLIPIILSIIVNFYVENISKKSQKLNIAVYSEVETEFLKSMSSDCNFYFSKDLNEFNALKKLNKFNVYMRFNKNRKIDIDNRAHEKMFELFKYKLDFILNREESSKALHSYEINIKVGKKKIETKSYYLINWIIMSIIMGSIMFTAFRISDEYDKKTVFFLILSPINLLEMIVGKGLLTFIMQICAVLLIIILNKMGSVISLSLIVFIIVNIVLYIYIGILIGLLGKNTSATGNFANITFLMLYILPMTIQSTSGPLKDIVKLLPSFYTLRGFQVLLINKGSISSIIDILIVMGIFIVFLNMASKKFYERFKRVIYN